MAWIHEVPRQRGTAYEARWLDEDRKSKARWFDTREDADRFLESIGQPARTRRGRGPTAQALAERIRALSEPDANGCWIWRKRLSNVGYGQIGVRRPEGVRTMSAHRVSYEAFVGPIPDGLVIDHLCRVRACVNPEHLEPVTQRQNVMRSPIAPGAINAAKTHCPKDHPYDDENTVHYMHKNGTTRVRLCRTCQRDSARRADRRRRAQEAMYA